MIGHVFGYGSLANRRTHDYARSEAAVLTGWRREWRTTRLRELAFLSARPAQGSQILGLAAEVPVGSWTALDRREAAYLRHDVTGSVTGAAPRVVTYGIDPKHLISPCRGAVLLSYLDTVAEGFFDLAGAEGVAGFFATTDGWARPVIDDRAAPLYGRATAPPARLRAMVDEALADLGGIVVESMR